PTDLLGDPAPVRPATPPGRRARGRDQGLAGESDGTSHVSRSARGEGGQERVPLFPTSLGTSSPDTITLLVHDLAADLIGKVTFGELALWLVTQQRPTPSQVRVFEAVLVALADHGFTPTAIATRLTYLSAPDSVQGAIAAGLLGGGSRFLGVTED